MSNNVEFAEFLAAIGVAVTPELFAPVVEFDEDDEDPVVFIKFMSDGGKEDARQGSEFLVFLQEKGVDVEMHSPRSFSVNRNALINAGVSASYFVFE